MQHERTHLIKRVNELLAQLSVDDNLEDTQLELCQREDVSPQILVSSSKKSMEEALQWFRSLRDCDEGMEREAKGHEISVESSFAMQRASTAMWSRGRTPENAKYGDISTDNSHLLSENVMETVDDISESFRKHILAPA